MARYGACDRADETTEQLDLYAVRVVGHTKPPHRVYKRVSFLGVCTVWVGLSALALIGLFVNDALVAGPVSPRWLYAAEACVGLGFQVFLIAGQRASRHWTHRRLLATEDRLLQSQAEIRTQIALMRSEMAAHLAPLPDGVRAYGERRASEVALALCQKDLEATGTDAPGPRGIASVTRLPVGRASEN
jgi:hypothetical protein